MSGLNPMVSGSPETISATDQAHVQVTRLNVPASLWDKVIALLLALSIMVNVACWSIIRTEGMQHELKRYDVDVFKGEFMEKLADVRIENTRMFLDQCKK